MSKTGRQRLGRGLGALLGEGLLDSRPGNSPEGARTVPVDTVVPNPYQPRREFGEPELAELAASIRENGLLQPLVVRPDPQATERFQLVAGERRLRAVGRLGWTEVSVIVRDVDDRTLLVLALVENLQREALGPLEEAEGYQALTEEFGLTQAEVAEVVGKNRSTVANMLRLLRLPPSVRRLLNAGDLSMGHARALLSVEEPGRLAELARQAVRNGWSVRDVEKRVRTGARGNRGRRPSKSSVAGDPVLLTLQEALREALGTRVRLRGGDDGKGTIEIPFRSADDFDRIFSCITGKEPSEIAG